MEPFCFGSDQLHVSYSVLWRVDAVAVSLCAVSIRLSTVISYARDMCHICDLAISV